MTKNKEVVSSMKNEAVPVEISTKTKKILKDSFEIVVLEMNSNVNNNENYHISVECLNLNNNARYIVLAHNHPSNNIQPSQEDIIATSKFENAIKTINKFELIDHIIVGKNKYFSFYDNNLLSNSLNINKKIKK